MKPITIGLLVALALGLIVGSQAVFTIDETEQALVLEFGAPKQLIQDPGLKFKTPFIQQVITYDKRILNVDPTPEELFLAGKNQRLVVDTFARYKIVDPLKFYQTLNNEYIASERLTSIINSSLRSSLGNFTLQDVLSSERSKIMNEIQGKVNQSAKSFGIEIVDLRIGRADFPKQVSENIYKQMQSDRLQEAQLFRAQGDKKKLEITSEAEKQRSVILAEAEKTAQNLRGEGDEIAIKTYADAFNKDPDFYEFYRTMEAYRTALGDDQTTFVLSPDSEFLKYIQSIRRK